VRQVDDRSRVADDLRRHLDRLLALGLGVPAQPRRLDELEVGQRVELDELFGAHHDRLGAIVGGGCAGPPALGAQRHLLQEGSRRRHHCRSRGPTRGRRRSGCDLGQEMIEARPYR
jgi:hypothetical protein